MTFTARLRLRNAALQQLRRVVADGRRTEGNRWQVGVLLILDDLALNLLRDTQSASFISQPQWLAPGRTRTPCLDPSVRRPDPRRSSGAECSEQIAYLRALVFHLKSQSRILFVQNKAVDDGVGIFGDFAFKYIGFGAGFGGCLG